MNKEQEAIRRELEAINEAKQAEARGGTTPTPPPRNAAAPARDSKAPLKSAYNSGETSRAPEAEAAQTVDILRGDGLGFNVAECANLVIPAPTWRVDKLIGEHVTVLAGKSGCRKSWLALDAACGVATGGKVAGHFQCEQGKVLYLALEDNMRRVLDRIDKLGYDRKALSNLDIRLEIPLAANGGMEWIEQYMKINPNTGLIIVDVLACFRGVSRPGNIYEVQYEDMRVFREFARRHDVSLLLITHTNKAGAINEIRDPLDLINGSTAIRGAANMKIAMYDAANVKDAHILHRQCKDLDPEDERDIVLTHDGAKFVYGGLKDEIDVSAARNEIIDAMKYQGAQTAKQLAEILGGRPNTYTIHLRRMAEKGIVRNIGIGKYVLG